MSNLSAFLKKNKVTKKNTFYPATKSLCDDNGNPLLWEIKALSTKENDQIRDDCMMEVPVVGKPNQYRMKLNMSKYIAKMITASIVFPDLHDKDLQDSYGVMTPEDLIKEMVDDYGEYNDLASFVQGFNGFDTTLDEKVEDAKN